MKSFKRFLKEAKQVGILYHLTNLDGMEYILRDNKLRRGSYEGISFTRNKMLNFYIGSPVNLFFKLIINGDKLSEKYKLEPYKYHANDKGIDFRKEAEELIRASEISNISKYIKGIAFIYDNFERREKDYNEGPDKLFYYGNFKTFLNDDLKDLLNRIHQKYPLFVQIESQIKKDDKWFKDKNLIN